MCTPSRTKKVSPADTASYRSSPQRQIINLGLTSTVSPSYLQQTRDHTGRYLGDRDNAPAALGSYRAFLPAVALTLASPRLSCAKVLKLELGHLGMAMPMHTAVQATERYYCNFDWVTALSFKHIRQLDLRGWAWPCMQNNNNFELTSVPRPGQITL